MTDTDKRRRAPVIELFPGAARNAAVPQPEPRLPLPLRRHWDDLLATFRAVFAEQLRAVNGLWNEAPSGDESRPDWWRTSLGASVTHALTRAVGAVANTARDASERASARPALLPIAERRIRDVSRDTHGAVRRALVHTARRVAPVAVHNVVMHTGTTEKALPHMFFDAVFTGLILLSERIPLLFEGVVGDIEHLEETFPGAGTRALADLTTAWRAPGSISVLQQEIIVEAWSSFIAQLDAGVLEPSSTSGSLDPGTDLTAEIPNARASVSDRAAARGVLRLHLSGHQDGFARIDSARIAGVGPRWTSILERIPLRRLQCPVVVHLRRRSLGLGASPWCELWLARNESGRIWSAIEGDGTAASRLARNLLGAAAPADVEGPNLHPVTAAALEHILFHIQLGDETLRGMLT